MFTRILNSIGWLLDRLSVVIGAWCGSQFPQFMQQYTQRLGGHVDELSYLVTKLNQIAMHSNKSLHEYANKFLNLNDPDLIAQGQFLHEIITRLESLSISLKNLLESSIWNRWYYFFSQLDTETAAATLRNFQPGFSMNLEGVIYAGIGILVGYSLYHGILKLLKLIFHVFKP